MAVRSLTLLPSGERVAVRDGETLEAALVRSGYTRPRRGCRRGGCGQCKVQLVSGDVADERPIAGTVLPVAERAAGSILLCRALALGDVTVLVADGQVRCVSPIQRALAARDLPARPDHRAIDHPETEGN